ncbi:ENTH-domain-containing protein [Dendrothele bispora CBS 962.96]|uniref:ENTH-domain-containing protein n=1 Tax=Dendrothele bispora (strain CBS 962.96) TaxID=1314807 RepID=A0A4S8L3I4_DENBC|nr:ENTH-domain-containing protein [Dendrothele bispora CBS 962.96]
MDTIENLGKQLSQITMYDIKSMYTQAGAKNVVLNVSEIEAKVQEATNDDPWGASSTLMQDIANRTFNYPDFNEIMPSIYSRYMEKEARQWRQIYKALQLLEYLIKHGSERVVDDARSHISTIKMLRNFHYIDDKGKDQGINGTCLPLPLSLSPSAFYILTTLCFSYSPQPSQRDRRTPL